LNKIASENESDDFEYITFENDNQFELDVSLSNKKDKKPVVFFKDKKKRIKELNLKDNSCNKIKKLKKNHIQSKQKISD